MQGKHADQQHTRITRRSTRAGLLFVALTGGLMACSSHPRASGGAATSDEKRSPQALREIEGEPLFDVLPRDAIRSIDEPRFVGAGEGQEFMLPDEPVLGVVGVHGTARAYSAWLLDRHEIVNDVLDGQPVMATW